MHLLPQLALSTLKHTFLRHSLLTHSSHCRSYSLSHHPIPVLPHTDVHLSNADARGHSFHDLLAALSPLFTAATGTVLEQLLCEVHLVASQLVTLGWLRRLVDLAEVGASGSAALVA